MQDFATGGRGPDKTGGVEEVAADERSGSVNQSRSAQGNNSGGSPGEPRPLHPPLWKWTANFSDSVEDPVVLLGDDDLSAFKAKVNDVSLCAESATAPGAGLFDSLETAFDSTTLALLCSFDGWHDIDDFPETALRLPLAEQRASTSNSIHPHTPSSRLSSEDCATPDPRLRSLL